MLIWVSSNGDPCRIAVAWLWLGAFPVSRLTSSSHWV